LQYAKGLEYKLRFPAEHYANGCPEFAKELIEATAPLARNIGLSEFKTCAEWCAEEDTARNRIN